MEMVRTHLIFQENKQLDVVIFIIIYLLENMTFYLHSCLSQVEASEYKKNLAVYE